MLFYHALHTCGEKKKVRQRDDMMVVLGLSVPWIIFRLACGVYDKRKAACPD